MHLFSRLLYYLKQDSLLFMCHRKKTFPDCLSTIVKINKTWKSSNNFILWPKIIFRNKSHNIYLFGIKWIFMISLKFEKKLMSTLPEAYNRPYFLAPYDPWPQVCPLILPHFHYLSVIVQSHSSIKLSFHNHLGQVSHI